MREGGCGHGRTGAQGGPDRGAAVLRDYRVSQTGAGALMPFSASEHTSLSHRLCSRSSSCTGRNTSEDFSFGIPVRSGRMFSALERSQCYWGVVALWGEYAGGMDGRASARCRYQTADQGTRRRTGCDQPQGVSIRPCLDEHRTTGRCSYHVQAPHVGRRCTPANETPLCALAWCHLSNLDAPGHSCESCLGECADAQIIRLARAQRISWQPVSWQSVQDSAPVRLTPPQSCVVSNRRVLVRGTVVCLAWRETASAETRPAWLGFSPAHSYMPACNPRYRRSVAVRTARRNLHRTAGRWPASSCTSIVGSLPSIPRMGVACV